ncbi:hypothetical protein AB0395_37415 [Streptosporangium sp. NPDC051023]|uniref:hypothetical protein n=1 Tax=Streptosporangium sp. NPDC051023 TaxID=3155410 RepID=UPI00344CD334
MIATAAGDFDYDTHGHGYAVQRRTDPRIAAYVHAALGDARTVVNVGAGAGSYEPDDRYVLAVEPSAAMRAQRPATAVPALEATAEARGVGRLRDDLASGAWDARYGALRSQPEFVGSLRLIVGHPRRKQSPSSMGRAGDSARCRATNGLATPRRRTGFSGPPSGRLLRALSPSPPGSGRRP